MNNKKVTGCLFLLIPMLIIAGIVSFYMCFDETETVDIGISSTTDEAVMQEEISTTEALFAVHITGCVTNPGVFYLEEGAIVNDVVNLAGGLTKDADVSVTNLAERITDGMMIVIYSKEQVQKGEVKINQSGSSLVNINTAGKEELMELPGIGESKADAIIAYRRENGGFNDITEIMNISGIKEAVFNKIKDYITT